MWSARAPIRLATSGACSVVLKPSAMMCSGFPRERRFVCVARWLRCRFYHHWLWPSFHSLSRGAKPFTARTGCYLVDYSFVETEALKPGYVKDNRVYDVNLDKSIKEWIVATDISPTRIKLQHVLQGVGPEG